MKINPEAGKMPWIAYLLLLMAVVALEYHLWTTPNDTLEEQGWAGLNLFVFPFLVILLGVSFLTLWGFIQDRIAKRTVSFLAFLVSLPALIIAILLLVLLMLVLFRFALSV